MGEMAEHRFATLGSMVSGLSLAGSDGSWFGMRCLQKGGVTKLLGKGQGLHGSSILARIISEGLASVT